MDIIKFDPTFDPTFEKLQSIVAETAKITALDLADDTQLAVVKGTRIQLRDARVMIEKQGKGMREDALKYQRDVIAREKELIAIIEPEEKRLKAIEEEANTIRERKAREALLPMRREQLLPLGVAFTDETLLDMDNDEFIEFLNTSTALKNERDRQEIEAEKAKLARAAELAAAAEDARVAERARIEATAKLNEEHRIHAEAQKKHEAELAAQKLIDNAKIEAARIEMEAQKEIDAKKAEAERAIMDTSIITPSQVEKSSQVAGENSLAEDAVLLRNRLEEIERDPNEERAILATRSINMLDLIIPLLDDLDGTTV